MASAVRCRAARARACWNISCTSVPRWPLVSARRFSIMSSAVALSPRLSRRSIWSVTCDAVGVRRVSTPGWTALSTLARPSQPPSGMGSRVVRLALGLAAPPPDMDWANEGPADPPARARAIRATQKRGLIVTWASVKVANPPRLRARPGRLLYLSVAILAPEPILAGRPGRDGGQPLEMILPATWSTGRGRSRRLAARDSRAYPCHMGMPRRSARPRGHPGNPRTQ